MQRGGQGAGPSRRKAEGAEGRGRRAQAQGAALWTTYDQVAGRGTFAANDLGAALWTTYDQVAGRGTFTANDCGGQGAGVAARTLWGLAQARGSPSIQLPCLAHPLRGRAERSVEAWVYRRHVRGVQASESVKICPGKVSALLGSARKGNGPLLKPVYQNLSLECPNISQGDNSMSQKCEGHTLKPVRKWGNLKNSVKSNGP